jgi:DNA-binding transcriptional regulator YiaG
MPKFASGAEAKKNKEIRKFDLGSEVVKEWRTASGLTQGQMAKRFNVKRGKIAHWEQGRSMVPSALLNYLKKNWPKENK